MAARATLGVPEITHVVALIESPAGQLPLFGEPGFTAQAVTEEPLGFNIKGETLMAWPTLPEVPVELA